MTCWGEERRGDVDCQDCTGLHKIARIEQDCTGLPGLRKIARIAQDCTGLRKIARIATIERMSRKNSLGGITFCHESRLMSEKSREREKR
jgi:hypothetical protein